MRGLLIATLRMKMGQLRKNCMADPEKIHHWSMQIQLGTMHCNPRLRHTIHLPSHFTRASKVVYMKSPTPTPRCVPITYHMFPPFVYEGPAVAVLLPNQKRMPGVTHLSWGQNLNIYQDGVAGPPVHKNSSPDMTWFPGFHRLAHRTFLSRPTAATT